MLPTTRAPSWIAVNQRGQGRNQTCSPAATRRRPAASPQAKEIGIVCGWGEALTVAFDARRASKGSLIFEDVA
ncbi:MAG TPA: hypothetical protein VGM05_34700, partial [Planctomycetaceae bacterium]